MGPLRLACANLILISPWLISSYEIPCLVLTLWPGKSGTQTYFQLVLRCSCSFSAWQVWSMFTPQKLCSTTGFCKGAGKLWRKRTETWRRRVLTGAQHWSRIFSFDTFFCPRTVLIGSGLAEEEGRSFHGETICRVSWSHPDELHKLCWTLFFPSCNPFLGENILNQQRNVCNDLLARLCFLWA